MTDSKKFAVSVPKGSNTCNSRKAKAWCVKSVTWKTFAQKCSKTTRTSETMAEYLAKDREAQTDIKDVGCFVAGTLKDGTRGKATVEKRTMLTLDIDNAGTHHQTADSIWERFTNLYDVTALCYSTHKHTGDAPRLRLIIPTDRDMTPAEYEAAARYVAGQIGISLFDSTTFQTSRLMFWPSTPKDGEFYYKEHNDGWISVDSILEKYDNWQNAEDWPRSDEDKATKHALKNAEDPTKKTGIVGAFCRAYSIEDAICAFLDDVYKPTTQAGRYTYSKGTTWGGLVCYDGLWAYSNHGTDPASRQLCNAFDLVRIHKFGEKDKRSTATETTKLASYKAMIDFATEDPGTKRELFKNAADDFAGIDLDKDTDKAPAADAWKEQLKTKKDGTAVSNYANVKLILENDPRLKGKLWLNEFDETTHINDAPWNFISTRWSDEHEANMRDFFCTNYGITGKQLLQDCVRIISTNHARHIVREYLNALEWDGVERLDTLIIKYIGAEDTPLTRTMTRKHFTAAVARIMKPGCKYDYCLVLTGPQGAGKSTLFEIMGGAYYNGSITTIEGKEGRESLRGQWIIELAELNGIRRSEVEKVKAYISDTADKYRAPYATMTTEHPRQCVFCATTNETFFLKDSTGNRRFWIIQINPQLRDSEYANFREALKRDRDQIWAEALQRYKDGETLYLSSKEELQLKKLQENYDDDSDEIWKTQLLQYLDRPVPVSWRLWELARRRAYCNSPDTNIDQTEATELRQTFTAVEFLIEMRGVNPDKCEKYQARKINAFMRTVEGWEEVKSIRTGYGTQRGFRRIWKETEDDI